jgi:hypothetical protein
VSLDVSVVERDVRRLDDEPAALRHGVARVRRQVDENLLDLPGVGEDSAPFGTGVEVDSDVLLDDAPQHPEEVLDDVVYVDGPALELLLAAEGEQLPGQFRAAPPG